MTGSTLHSQNGMRAGEATVRYDVISIVVIPLKVTITTAITIIVAIMFAKVANILGWVMDL